MTKAEEQIIIARIKRGEQALYAELVGCYSELIFPVICRIVGNRDDAQEICQDVFVKAYFALGSYRGGSSFSTWIYRIAYNAAISKVRKKEKMRYADDETLFSRVTDEDFADMMNYTDNHAMLALLDNALESLTSEDRFLVLMFYKEEKSIEELSEITSISQSNVKVRLHRIRKRLARLIQDQRNNENEEN